MRSVIQSIINSRYSKKKKQKKKERKKEKKENTKNIHLKIQTSKNAKRLILYTKFFKIVKFIATYVIYNL